MILDYYYCFLSAQNLTNDMTTDNHSAFNRVTDWRSTNDIRRRHGESPKRLPKKRPWLVYTVAEQNK